MIRNEKELIKETKKYFGKNRDLLKKTVKNLVFDGKRYKEWKQFFKKYGEKKIEVGNRIFQDFSENLINKRYRKLDWNWIGDLSWDIEIVLNKEVDRVYDFDKKLATKCRNNIMRHLNIYISDIIPAYTIVTYFGFYKDNIYEFGPLRLNKYEKKFIDRIKKDLKDSGYYFVSQKVALKKFKELKSDLNSEGNASIFDCLFNDLDNYTLDYVRFSDKYYTDAVGIQNGWREFYDRKRRLTKTEHYRSFINRQYDKVITDKDGNLIWAEFDSVIVKPNITLDLKKIKERNKGKYSVNYK